MNNTHKSMRKGEVAKRPWKKCDILVHKQIRTHHAQKKSTKKTWCVVQCVQHPEGAEMVEGGRKMGPVSNGLVSSTKVFRFYLLNNSLQSGGHSLQSICKLIQGKIKTSLYLYFLVSFLMLSVHWVYIYIYIYIFMCHLKRKINKLGPYSDFLLM